MIRGDRRRILPEINASRVVLEMGRINFVSLYELCIASSTILTSFHIRRVAI